MAQAYKKYIPVIHESSYTAPNSTIIGMVVIEEDCSIWHNAVLRGDIDWIMVKKGTNIQDNATIHCSHGMKTVISEYCTVGHGAILHSCTVGEGSLVGMGAVLLDGVVVGKNCLIGAGSLITPNTVIPDNSLVIGSPAKVKRELTTEEIKGIRENTMEYIRLKEEYLKQEK